MRTLESEFKTLLLEYIECVRSSHDLLFGDSGNAQIKIFLFGVVIKHLKALTGTVAVGLVGNCEQLKTLAVA